MAYRRRGGRLFDYRSPAMPGIGLQCRVSSPILTKADPARFTGNAQALLALLYIADMGWIKFQSSNRESRSSITVKR